MPHCSVGLHPCRVAACVPGCVMRAGGSRWPAASLSSACPRQRAAAQPQPVSLLSWLGCLGWAVCLGRARPGPGPGLGLAWLGCLPGMDWLAACLLGCLAGRLCVRTPSRPPPACPAPAPPRPRLPVTCRVSPRPPAACPCGPSSCTPSPLTLNPQTANPCLCVPRPAPPHPRLQDGCAPPDRRMPLLLTPAGNLLLRPSA